MQKVRVWDLPTRVFHWLLVLTLLGSFITVNLPGDWMLWHFRFGYAVLALLLFRLVWGVVGPRYARFSSFAPNPFAAWVYVRGQAQQKYLGHNPLGAWSVYAVLALLLVQIGTGLFANDAILWDGPLRHWISGETSDALTRLHKLNRWLIIAWVVLHLTAISYYHWMKKQALVSAMLTGDAATEVPQAVSARDDALVRGTGLLLLALTSAAVWGLLRLAGS